MKPILIVSPWLCRRLSLVVDVYAICLWPVILSVEPLEGRSLNHELIHFRQQQELLVLPFYLLYAFFYVSLRFSGLNSDQAYKLNPFEIEAYKNSSNVSYFADRKWLAWSAYVGD